MAIPTRSAEIRFISRDVSDVGMQQCEDLVPGMVLLDTHHSWRPNRCAFLSTSLLETKKTLCLECSLRPFKHGHGSKNLMVSQCLQTSSSIQALHSTTQTITRTFTMRCCKEMPDCFNSKVFEVETDIIQIRIVFVLSSTSITEIVQRDHKGKLSFDVRYPFVYECVNCEGVMLQVVRNHAQIQVIDLTLGFEVHYKWMQCCLRVIPLEQLHHILG